MVYRPEKTIGNEHQKFTTMDKYKAKQKPDIMQVADLSQRDIDLSKAIEALRRAEVRVRVSKRKRLGKSQNRNLTPTG